jgi:hypothetical protein
VCVTDARCFSFPPFLCPCSRLQERARVQGDREERWEVGPVGEVGGAAVRTLPLRPAVPRGRRPRRLAADTDGGVARPPGVPRGADRGRLALHCGVRFRRRRRAVLPAATRALPLSVRIIRSRLLEIDAALLSHNALIFFYFFCFGFQFCFPGK